MAEAVVTVMLKNLNSLICKEFGLLWGVDKEMRRLSSILETICAVLHDAERDERQSENMPIKDWLQKLKDVYGKMDDILDECSMEASRLEYKSQRFGSTQKVRASVLSFMNPKNIWFRYHIAKKIQDVLERLDEIANERLKFHLREREVVEDRRPVQVRKNRETGSVDQKHVYGREEDKDKIVQFLVENSRSSKDLSVYPIVGMGGLGKTTLARLVFNDKRVGENFEMKIWVCVSEDFDEKRLIKAMIESATTNICDDMGMDPLQKRLQSILGTKRFLLVLDDVWNHNRELWEGLRNVLACGSNGSSIVVTTRLIKVASIMGTTPMHRLSRLPEDDCWSVFKHSAFLNEREERPNLVKIGKEIVRKCKGNPLAAKTLGSLLQFESEEKKWLSVMESELWNLPQEETHILPALRLSYLHLPIDLRRCFAFCAIFPKDFKIEKVRLIHLWIANDLISSKGKMEVEEIGNDIFKELYWRSFFQKEYHIDRFTMHDLVHDLAQYIMKDEVLHVSEIDCPDHNLSRVRHMTFNSSEPTIFDMRSALYKPKSLRTLVLMPSVNKFPYGLYFRSLRAFVARRSSIELSCLSSLIVSSKHLRYLNLSGAQIRFLPEPICSLQSLQTLDVSHCYNLQKLPKHMSRLRSLCHLYIEGCRLLNHMPPNIGKLSCLRSLSRFIVDRRRGYDTDELGSLLKLGGSLRIEHLEKVKSPVEAKKANLVGKTNLQRLHLHWYYNLNEVGDQKLNEQVLDALEPPPTLKLLEISNFRGGHFPHWFNADFENLISIDFSYCKNSMELPTAMGKLPSLTSLYLRDMDCLRYVDNESYNGQLFGGFFRLETLRILYLPNLERLSRVERSHTLPRLSNLDIGGCPKLTSLHYLPSIEKLYVTKCNETVLESVSNLHTLKSLYISDNDDLASFPDGFLHNLTALKSLGISRFRKLQDLPSDMLIGLTALEKLSISHCEMLECFPTGIFQGLISLKEIHIKKCRKLKGLSDSFGDLTALESLQLQGCSELETFPDGLNNLSSLQRLTLVRLAALPENLKHLPSLKYMEISGFPNLENLPEWLGDLTSLSSLSISNCRNLEYLPKCIQHLTNLQSLAIGDCRKLKKRCKNGIGEDWHKIAHIPRIHVWPAS
ncbi:disease resistance protein RGA2 [Ziziphus jujuba]|uniref:Disease resistance protein RGA2 n=1 Tax=Ziziphus jujuba TaxID=326968 RepID=A0A6P6GMV9_ZIZJJ|nr:disease resistance protein RGA2 [Ziziphus jujuba]XP_060674285.1 disease resistance protein RGA2 [Ziziphus jujuba]